MRTLKLTIEYDGTDFSGWQRQEGQRTVQVCIEDALFEMTGERVLVRGAGRTDAGVHALGQVAHARVESKIPIGGMLRGLNGLLPPDISIVAVDEVPETFDARFSARGKIYRYQIWNHLVRSPMHHRTAWYHRAPLDVAAMRAAAQLFVGEHDFRGFRAADCERRTTVRVLRRFDVDRSGPLIVTEVEGTAFLKNMVRILVGTLVAVGRGAMRLEDVNAILVSGDRTRAGQTAPAAGLTLVRVIY